MILGRTNGKEKKQDGEIPPSPEERLFPSYLRWGIMPWAIGERGGGGDQGQFARNY